MGMCMDMCSQMLPAIKTTSALAVFATPELQHAFDEWLTHTEGEVDAAAIASALNRS